MVGVLCAEAPVRPAKTTNIASAHINTSGLHMNDSLDLLRSGRKREFLSPDKRANRTIGLNVR
jgi:hypothetical protein